MFVPAEKYRHTYHIVDFSPWPLMASLGAFLSTFGGALYMHGYKGGFSTMLLGIFLITSVMYGWWRDVVRESTFEGKHTAYVQQGLRIGVILFIVSEVMFFLAFFWAFFHASLSPSHALGGVWPPMNLTTISPMGMPLLNTIILLSSGATVTWAHHALVFASKKEGAYALFFTIFLALVFTRLQGFEYTHSPFSISDGVYGSSFFMATGFHGFHVLVGTCFLIVCLIRLLFNHFSSNHHFGFEAAAWYWHFVDVVWLFLFISVYWWGSGVA